jgi:hypothetical protein
MEKLFGLTFLKKAVMKLLSELQIIHSASQADLKY